MLSDSSVTILDIYRLAVGPSLQYTTGALFMGVTFRERLSKIPAPQESRILIELRGAFSDHIKSCQTDIAVVAGLAGYHPGESHESLSEFYGKVKKNGGFGLHGRVYPFNPEADLVRPPASGTDAPDSSIRFHLLDTAGKPLLQAEYRSDENGRVSGSGLSPITTEKLNEEFLNLEYLHQVLESEEITLGRLYLALESERLQQSSGTIRERLAFAWKIMGKTAENAVGISQGSSAGESGRASGYFINYQHNLFSSTRFSPDVGKAAWYAYGISSWSSANNLIISAPGGCMAGVLPAVFLILKEKFRLSDEQLTDGMLAGAFFYLMVKEGYQQVPLKLKILNESSVAVIMAVTGGLAMLGFDSHTLEAAASLALIEGNEHGHESPELRIEHLPHLNALAAMQAFHIMDMVQILAGHETLLLKDTIKQLALIKRGTRV